MKTALCIDYFFPPLAGGWVGGFKFIRLLPEFGWRPIVVSASETVRYDKDYSLLDHLPKGIEVHRTGHREPFPAVRFLMGKVGLGYEFPDYYGPWFKPALRMARDILRREKIDLLVSISPTYTTTRVALRLKHEFNIPWIAELEDAWSENHYLLRDLGHRVAAPLRKHLLGRIRAAERDMVQHADKIISIHREHVSQLTRDYGGEPGQFEVIMDGYYESDYRGLQPHTLYPGRPNIVFLGSSYGGFQKTAEAFITALNEVDRTAEAVFIGRAARVLMTGKLPNTTLIGPLPKEKALSFGAGGDFLLVITLPEARWHTPSKVYDYLRLGKPILAIVPTDGDAARTIREARGGFILSYDRETMKTQLEQILSRWRAGEFRGWAPDGEYIRQFERRTLTERIVRVFDAVAK